MLNVPNNMKIDLRQRIVKGEINDRLQGMRLEQKFDPISKAQWKIKQNELYLNTLRIKNDPSLEQLLANELENKNQGDPLIIKQISNSLLLKITDKKISEYILERLTLTEMNRMNQYWSQIVNDLKKNNLKLNKDTFISILKRNIEEPIDVNLLDDVAIDPDANEDILDQGLFDNNLEEEKPYPKSNENNNDFINRIMNSKSFVPGNEEEKTFLEDTLIEIAGLKTQELLLYIFKRSGRNIKKSTKKSILEEVATEVGVQHKIYWSNYEDKNEGNLKTGNGLKVEKMGKKKDFWKRNGTKKIGSE